MGKHQDNNLHAAARAGDLSSVVNILASNPIAVNSRDKHSRTPLHLAAWSGHAQIVIYLCQNKADVGAAALDDMGAIHFAAQKGHLEVVRALVSAGVSVKACNRKGFTPLHYAVQGSHSEVAKYLLKKGASLSSKTKSGKTPLDLANNEEFCSFWLKCEKFSGQGDDLKMVEQTDAILQSPEKSESSSKAENVHGYVGWINLSFILFLLSRKPSLYYEYLFKKLLFMCLGDYVFNNLEICTAYITIVDDL